MSIQPVKNIYGLAPIFPTDLAAKRGYMIKGINIKSSHINDNELVVGIKIDEFIESLQALDKEGWANFIITPLKVAHTKGYTHTVYPQAKPKKNGRS